MNGSVAILPTTTSNTSTTNVVEDAQPASKDSTTGVSDQSSRMPLKKVLTVFGVLQIILFLSFMDQTSVTTVLPSISNELGAANRIGWVGTSFLIAQSSSQMILARFSDIFGRKAMLVVVIIIFMFGNILCGFAQNSIWLFAARGISGVGAGGLNSLAMIIVSDIVSLKERGRFQGLTAIAVGLGNGTGPLIGGALSTISWRWAFWVAPPLLALSLIPLWIFLPQKPTSGDFKHKVKQVDFLGSLLSLGGVLLVLVPLSGGGTIYAWNSALVISMLIAGVLVLLLFLIVENRVAKMPVLPLRIFKYRTVALVCVATFGQGWVFYAQLFYLPVYFQEVRGLSAVMSGIMILPMVVIQPIFSTICGNITTRTGYITPLIWIGFTVHLLASGLMYHFNESSKLGFILPSLAIVGAAIGMTTQTTLVAAQAGAPSTDRAVVTGARNTARSIGGAIGLATCGTIRNSVLRTALSQISGLSAQDATVIVQSGIANVHGTVSQSVFDEAKSAIMKGLHFVFLSYLPIMGLSMLAVWCIKNERIMGEEKEKQVQPAPIPSRMSTSSNLNIKEPIEKV